MAFIPGPTFARLALRFPLRGLFLGKQVVRDGQTLDRTIQWLLALEKLGDLPPLTEKTPEIARANADKIEDPNLIFPGQVLALPGMVHACRVTTASRAG